MKKISLLLCLILTVPCLICGCKGFSSREDVNSFVRDLLRKDVGNAAVNQTFYEQDSLSEADLAKYVGDAPTDLENYSVRYVKYEPTGGLEQLNNYGQYDDILYPGAIVDISSPTVKNIGIDQTPVTMSISLDTVTSGSFRPYVMKNPSLANARTAVNKLVKNSMKTLSKYPTKLNMSVDIVDNAYDFNLAAGLAITYDSLGIGDKFDYKTYNSGNSLVLTLSQIYYTIDVDAKKDAQSYFDKKLTSSSIKNSLQDTVPVIVSSVSYGRVAIIKLSSDESMTKWSNDLAVGVTGLFGVSSEISEAIERENVKAEIFIYGGNTKNDTVLGTSQDFEAIVKEFTAEINPEIAAAVPISYRFRNIYDFSLAKIGVVNDPMYVKQYVKKNSVLRLTLKEMEMTDYPSEWFSLLNDFEITGITISGRIDVKNYLGESIHVRDWVSCNRNHISLRFNDSKATVPYTALDISGIDNSKIISQDLVDLNFKFTFIVKCEKKIFGLIPNGENEYYFSGNGTIKGFDKISSVTGLYADFACNDARVRAYFDCELI